MKNSKTLLSVTIPGNPVAKERPRFSYVGGCPRSYTPEKTARWESDAAVVFRQHWTGAPVDEPLELIVVAVKSRPRKLSRKGNMANRVWRAAKPDADNVLKAVCDALELAGVVVNDSRLSRVVAESWYAAVDEEPRIEIRLSKLPMDSQSLMSAEPAT